MGKSRLLNWDRRWLSSVWKFTESDDARRFGQVWLRRAREIGEGRKENVS